VIFTSVMALSRVYLRAHWLSDTVAGALPGAGLALGRPALLMALRGRRQPVAPAPWRPGAGLPHCECCG
jgi:membrane-associated phospholipid phosphatase